MTLAPPGSGSPSVSLRTLLEEMIERQASDLHITAGERAKLRIDGAIVSSRCDAARRRPLHPRSTPRNCLPSPCSSRSTTRCTSPIV